MIITYNKLVRDRIPEIIEASWNECKTTILSDEVYLKMIDAKLDEELAEYHKDQSIEELADMLEVIRAAAIARGYTLEELEAVRARKAEERGGFEKKILLIETIEKWGDTIAEYRSATGSSAEDLFIELFPTRSAQKKRDFCIRSIIPSTVWKKLTETEKKWVEWVCEAKPEQYYRRITK